MIYRIRINFILRGIKLTDKIFSGKISELLSSHRLNYAIGRGEEICYTRIKIESFKRARDFCI